MKILPTLAAATLLLSGAAAADDEPCHIYHVAKFDMGVDASGGVYVPMTIAGHTVNLLIDTGGVLSMLTDRAVTDIGLERMAIVDGEFRVYGGVRIDHYTVARDLNLGGLKAPRMTMLILPDGDLPPTLSGTIAPDILGSYDDDFDFGNGKFTLFLKDHCPGKVVYWTADYAVVPMRVDDQAHITLPVDIDGQTVRAMIDTGTSRSVMSLETAKSLFHLKDGDPTLKASPEFGGAAFTKEFQTLTFDNVRVDYPDITLVPDSVSKMYGGTTPLILGMGILRQLHMYISYKEHKVYVTPASAH